MYFVKYGDKYLHDPRNESYTLIDLSLDCEENSCGYCDFTIYSDHPLYDKLKERDAANPIKVYDNDILLFTGFIYELGKEFYLDGRVRCKGELDYLSESIIRPYSTYERTFGELAPSNLGDYFEWVINKHNESVDEHRKFKIGVNDAYKIPNDYPLEFENDDYPTAIDELKRVFIGEDGFGGYLQIHYDKNNIRYIDYLYELNEVNTQILDFGVNLTDYTQTDDSSGLCTYIVPIGARLKDTDCDYNDGYFETSDTEPNEGKDYYVKDSTPIGYKGLTAFNESTTYYEHSFVYYPTEDETPTENKTYYIHLDEGKGYYQPIDNADFDYYHYDYFEKRTDTVPWVTLYKKSYDMTPVEGKTYYIYVWVPNISSEYTAVSNLEEFAANNVYYEQYDNYTITEDASPDATKEYYVMKKNYTACVDLTQFEDDITYYEYNQISDESNLYLTIDSLDDEAYGYGDFKKLGDKIYYAPSVEKYGWIGTVYSDTDIISKESLVTYAIYSLAERVSPKREIEIKAVDIHLINQDVSPIRIGEYVRVRSIPHNFDSYMLCRKISLNLNNPERSIYTLGTTYDTLIGEQDAKINELNATIDKYKEIYNG